MDDATINNLGLIWGVRAISEEIGRGYETTLRLLNQGLLPASRVGKTWCSNREALRRHFEERITPSAPSLARSDVNPSDKRA